MCHNELLSFCHHISLLELDSDSEIDFPTTPPISGPLPPGLLEVYWGWTDSASTGDQEEVY